MADKFAIITGGSTGIGAELVKLAVQDGYSVLTAADTFRPYLERDSSTGDVPNVLAASGTWQLPTGRNHRFANTALRTAFGTQEENTELDKVRDDSEIPDAERLLRGSDGAMLTDAISPLTRAFEGEVVAAHAPADGCAVAVREGKLNTLAG